MIDEQIHQFGETVDIVMSICRWDIHNNNSFMIFGGALASFVPRYAGTGTSWSRKRGSSGEAKWDCQERGRTTGGFRVEGVLLLGSGSKLVAPESSAYSYDNILDTIRQYSYVSSPDMQVTALCLSFFCVTQVWNIPWYPCNMFDSGARPNKKSRREEKKQLKKRKETIHNLHLGGKSECHWQSRWTLFLFVFAVLSTPDNFQPSNGIRDFLAITIPGCEVWLGQFLERHCHCFWTQCVFFGGLFGNLRRAQEKLGKNTLSPCYLVDIGSRYHDFDGFILFFFAQDFSSQFPKMIGDM